MAKSISLEARAILDSLRKTGRWESPGGIVQIQWLSDEGKGFIDVKNIEGTKGRKGYYQLLKKVLPQLDVIAELPADWQFNPDKGKKGTIYQMLGPRLKGNLKPNPDMPNNALTWNTKPKSNQQIMGIQKKTPDMSGFHTTSNKVKFLRNRGLTEWTDPETKELWKIEQNGYTKAGNPAYIVRNRTARNRERHVGGTRKGSTDRYTNKRQRGLVASSPELQREVDAIYAERDRLNSNKAVDDPTRYTVEHRIQQKAWKNYNLPGNPHDPHNLWLTTVEEAKNKSRIESNLRAKKFKGDYIVDFNPQTRSFHIIPTEQFSIGKDPTGLGLEIPESEWNSKDFDSKSLLGKLPTKAEGVRQLGNIITNNPITRGIGITDTGKLASILETTTEIAKNIPPGARFGMSILPGIGIIGDQADALVKYQEAQDDPTLLNQAQSWVAGTVAATSVIPEPTSQLYNFGAGLLLAGSDVVEHYGKEINRAIGSVQHPLKGFYKK